MVNGPITEEEVLLAIKKLKNNKASGPDTILNEYLKSTKDINWLNGADIEEKR